ncbi:Smr/MutS family protein [uncultured Mesonia sp.]|uniref:Smr/MutS family protein n=1 Tax=uncultured Mesonia sp. TaxID=399731 RepID=UPI00374EFCE6
MNFKPGDEVELIDENLSGWVEDVSGSSLTIQTSDGFILQVESDEVIKLENASLKVTEAELRQALKEKQPSKRKQVIAKRREKTIPAIEIDLHIEKLTHRVNRLDKYDILNLQIDTARHHLEKAIKNRNQRLVFIHGVGEGVLKQELRTLFSRYNQVAYEDADSTKYGFDAATAVYIYQKSIS